MGLPSVRVIGAAAVIASALVTQLFAFQNDDDIRAQAWAAAERAIRPSASYLLPQFLTWAQPVGIYPCGVAREASAGKIDFSESLYFNSLAAERMCKTQPGSGSSSLETSVQAFPAGSVLAAAFWYPLSRTKDPTLGSPVEIRIRKAGQHDEVAKRKIRIMIPESLNTDVRGCPVNEPGGLPAQSVAEEVRLDKFYWVRLGVGESYQNATCGDFAILLGFHLVYKVEGKGWLWSTFWWDDTHAPPFGPAPSTFLGAGDNPAAWSNYAMDAAFSDPGKVIYNPWRDSEVANRNCAACHQKLATLGESPQSSPSFDMVITAKVHF